MISLIFVVLTESLEYSYEITPVLSKDYCGTYIGLLRYLWQVLRASRTS